VRIARDITRKLRRLTRGRLRRDQTRRNSVSFCSASGERNPLVELLLNRLKDRAVFGRHGLEQPQALVGAWRVC
jgi:hypothetical protein